MASHHFVSLMLLLTHHTIFHCASAAVHHSQDLESNERDEDGAYKPRDSEHYRGSEHNMDFDHEAILGARSFVVILFRFEPFSLWRGFRPCVCSNSSVSRPTAVRARGNMSMKHVLMVTVPLSVALMYFFFLGSVKEAEEFDKLSPDEAKARLRQLLPKMDTNGDNSIDREELFQWILRAFMWVCIWTTSKCTT